MDIKYFDEKAAFSSKASSDEERISAATSSQSPGAVGASWRYSFPVMLCILLLSFGGTYSTATLPPLKVFIMK